MNYKGRHYRTVWLEGETVHLIDQNLLPFEFRIRESKDFVTTCEAIKRMTVRGAPAIGAAGAFAMAQAFNEMPQGGGEEFLKQAKEKIEQTRPTGQNLFAAVRRVFAAATASDSPRTAACREALRIADEDVLCCRKIGEFGGALIKDGARIMTHCNAGWLACVDYGTALAPVYIARESGKKLFVYVSETRPRSQGAKLTAWELKNENVPFSLFADGAGAYLMKKEKVDLVIVGADRIARNGDVANKIGTFEKAIAAKGLGIPFFVAAPTSTIDAACASGDAIPIEYRDKSELLSQTVLTEEHGLVTGQIYPEDFPAVNPGFDVTPALYITGYITERGIIAPKDFQGFAQGSGG
jgi:S-methyl-5-thioribose-1-phosphate isomerase